MHSVRLIIRLSGFCLLLTTGIYCNLAEAKNALNFSRAHQQLSSPDKLYLIQNLRKNKDSNLMYVETPDELVLTSKNLKNRSTILLKYHRNVDVFWAPDSKAVVVNYWKNNNFCDALLYRVSSLQRPISLRQLLIVSGISEEEKLLISNEEYSYVFVSKWDKPTEIVVKASGHYFLKNRTVVYTLHYLWDMKANKWKLLK